MTWKNGKIQIRDSDEVDGTIIQEIQESISESGRNLKVKTNDRMKALEMLAEHLGMLMMRRRITTQIS
nr:terminase small subunit [Thermoflavimicrobium dichotomicum]